jgi:rhodanese-related sulfurtransferase
MNVALQTFPGERTQEGYFEVHSTELAELPPDVRFIDVREATEFDGDLGHLPRAELVPLAAVVEGSQNWSPSSPLVVVCRSGRRSALAAALLSRLGFEEVANLVGGMLAVRMGTK